MFAPLPLQFTVNLNRDPCKLQVNMDVLFRKPKQNLNFYIRNHVFELLHAGARWSVLAWLACIWRAVYGVRLAPFWPCCYTGVVVSARLTC